jgi:hypothetical protein
LTERCSKSGFHCHSGCGAIAPHRFSFSAHRTAYKTLGDALIAAWPDVGVVAVTQNPQLSPQTAAQIAAHATRNRQIVSLAMAQRYGLVDTYRAMVDDPRGVAALVDTDGVHPTQMGSDLWRDVAKGLFAPWLTAITY